jgi:hypothetical protein
LDKGESMIPPFTGLPTIYIPIRIDMPRIIEEEPINGPPNSSTGDPQGFENLKPLEEQK